MKTLAVILSIFGALQVFADPKPFTGKTIAEVESFIRSEGLMTLEEFLPRLSREHRANFVLMRQSASIQRTDEPLRPRAILFGHDGELVLAFNGHGDSLEMMEKSGDIVKFERLEFIKGQPPVNDSRVCKVCHGGRPLWGQYRVWRGMYGGDQERVPSGSAEEKDYFAFLRAAKTDPLYGNLIFKCGGDQPGGITPGYLPRSAGPEMPSCAEVSSLVAGWAGSEKARLERRYAQPGQGMGELMNRINALRLHAKIRLSADYPALKNLIAANVLGCVGERMYDVNPGDPQGLVEMRRSLTSVREPHERAIRARAQAIGSQQTAFQGQIYEVLGLSLKDELRMDGLFGTNVIFRTDCERYNDYSPNASCNAGSTGYSAYSDGSDMGADLIGYLVLKEMALQDAALMGKLVTGLQSAREVFLESSRRGVGSADSVVRAIDGVLEDLRAPVSPAAMIPKYINDYAFTQLPRHGDGLGLCRMLLR